MATLFGKVSKWARSPQGQRVISQAARRAQQVAKDPATRAKVQQLRGRIGSGRQASGTTPREGGGGTVR